MAMRDHSTGLKPSMVKGSMNEASHGRERPRADTQRGANGRTSGWENPDHAPALLRNCLALVLFRARLASATLILALAKGRLAAGGPPQPYPNAVFSGLAFAEDWATHTNNMHLSIIICLNRS